jgi:hypothetical protein
LRSQWLAYSTPEDLEYPPGSLHPNEGIIMSERFLNIVIGSVAITSQCV